jgi:hypothetical protein
VLILRVDAVPPGAANDLLAITGELPPAAVFLSPPVTAVKLASGNAVAKLIVKSPVAFFVTLLTLPEARIVLGVAVVPLNVTHTRAEYEGADPEVVDKAVAVAALPEHDAAVVAVAELPEQDAAVVAVAELPEQEAAVVALAALLLLISLLT